MEVKKDDRIKLDEYYLTNKRIVQHTMLRSATPLGSSKNSLFNFIL